MQVEHYRKKLLRKALEDTAAPTPTHRNKEQRPTTTRHSDNESESERYSRSSKKEKRKQKRDRSSSGNKTEHLRLVEFIVIFTIIGGSVADPDPHGSAFKKSSGSGFRR